MDMDNLISQLHAQSPEAIAMAVAAVLFVFIILNSMSKSEEKPQREKSATPPVVVPAQAPVAMVPSAAPDAVPTPVAVAPKVVPAPVVVVPTLKKEQVSAVRKAPEVVVPQKKEEVKSVSLGSSLGPKLESRSAPSIVRQETKPPVSAPVEDDDDSDDSDSDAEQAPLISKSAGGAAPRKAEEENAEAAFGMTSSTGIDAFDGSWNEVKKSHKAKKPSKASTSSVSPVASSVSSVSPKTAAAFVSTIPTNEIITKASQHNNKKAMAAQAEYTPSIVAEHVPVVEAVPKMVKIVEIDSKKVGFVIGSAGSTLKAIQTATNCEIFVPKDRDADSSTVSVTVTGTNDKEVALCAKSVIEMATKGYCLLLKGENFSEGSIMVNAKDLGEIVGKGGSTLKAIQDKFDVKITTPQNVDRASTASVKVGVVGDKSAVKKAKETIRELSQYHHTEVTHPGVIHEEIPLDAAVHGTVIGKNGVEIKHIQGFFKVTVHIPNANSVHTGVLVVGEQDGVSKACAHINKIVEKALAPREEKPSEFELREQERAEQEDDEFKPWMQTYIKDPTQQVALDFNEFPGLAGSNTL